MAKKYFHKRFLPFVVLACFVAVPAGSGCAVSGGRSSARSELFATQPLPPDFDRARALLQLKEVPGRPTMPEAAEVAPDQLDDQERQLLDEARKLLVEHEYEKAIAPLENLLRRQPESFQVNRLTALARLGTGSDVLSAFFAERALKIRPDDLACRYIMGRLAEKDGKTREALAEYRLALRCPVGSGDRDFLALTHYRLGILLEREGYLLAAVEQWDAFDRLISQMGELSERNTELAVIVRLQGDSLALRRARAYELLERYVEAAAALHKAARHRPEDTGVRMALVRMLVLAGRMEEAARQAADFVEHSHGGRQAVRLLLAVYQQAGRENEGLRKLADLVAAHPDDLELVSVYVDALADAGRNEQAVSVLNEWINRFPHNVDARWKLVELYRMNGQWGLWRQAMLERLMQDPQAYSRGEAEVAQIEPETVQELLSSDSFVARDRAESEPVVVGIHHYLLALLNMRVDRLEQAQAHFEQAAEVDAMVLPAAVAQAGMYVDRCRWSEAMAVIESAQQKLESENADLQRLLGRCHDGLDQAGEAVQAYTRAIELAPDDLRARLFLGRLYERIGATDEAQRQFRAIIEAQPERLEVRETLIESYLVEMKSATDEQSIVKLHKQVMDELEEMQKRAPFGAATVRSAALLNYVISGERTADEYIGTLIRLVHHDPDDLVSREKLATTLFAHDLYEPARVQVEALLERDPCHADAGELAGMISVQRLDFERARQDIVRFLEYYPNRQRWIQTLANLYLLDRQFEGSVELWQRLVDLPGGDERKLYFRSQLLRVYRLGKMYDIARDLAEQWLSQADEKQLDDYRRALLTVEMDAENYGGYLEWCRQWLADNPENLNIRHWLLLGLQAAGRLDEAVMQALGWLADDPDHEYVVEWLVQALLAADQDEDALEVARNQVAAAAPGQSSIVRRYQYAQACLQARRYDEAVAAVQDLIERGRKEYSEVLGMILLQAGRYEEANARYREMLAAADENEPQKAQILRQMAFVYQKQGERLMATQRLREAHAFAPDDAGINNDLGYILAESGEDLAEAEQMIRLAVGDDYLQPAFLDSLGWVLYMQGRYEEAACWLDRASVLENGQDPIIFEHKGDALWRLDRREAAMEAWREALALQQEQAAQGQTEKNKELSDRVQAKLQAAKAGGQPEIAPVPTEGAH